MASNHYFYVLYCGDRTLYAGYTVNLNQRLKAHRTGRGAKYTRSRLPLTLIYAETWSTKSLAMRQEALFKRLTRPQKERYLQMNGLDDVRTTQFICVNKKNTTIDCRQQLEGFHANSTELSNEG